MLLLLSIYVVLRALWKTDVYLISTLVTKNLYYYSYYYYSYYYYHYYYYSVNFGRWLLYA